jgi:hypothetical protein
MSPSNVRAVKSRRLQWTGYVARLGETRNAYRILVGKQVGKHPLGSLRIRWEGNIKMNVTEIGCEDVRGMDLALKHVQQWDLVSAVLILPVLLTEG